MQTAISAIPPQLELYFDGADGSRHFRSPKENLIAWTPGQAFSQLDRAQEALSRGYAVAGMLAYEFGLACVELPLPPTLGNGNRGEDIIPLLQLGIYEPLTAPRQNSVERKPPSSEPFQACSAFHPRVSAEHYQRGFAEIKRLLYEGELYQLNFTVPFDLRFTGDPIALYEQLAPSSRAPHRAYLRTSHYALVSLSPELFLRFEPDRLTSKPMKGTSTSEAESELAAGKNQAEHVMIVDLLRNDLSRVCTDVQVARLFTIERYPTFSTMTSTIHGTRRPGTTLSDIFRALFPCGSVTGAPKRAAMQKIRRIEQSPRGAYCGTIGYLLPDGTGSWNVAIRTLQLNLLSGLGRLDLGGGIVADSDGHAEWKELLLKGLLYTQLAPFSMKPLE